MFDWLFDRFLGIPLHPLAVHVPVVLVPMLIMFALAYALVPRIRRHIGWLVVLLAVIAPLSAFIAKKAGEAFRNIKVDKAREANVPIDLTDINNHASYGDATLWSSIALGVLVLAFVWLVWRSAGTPPSTLITAVAAVLILGASVASAYYVFKAGDSGAHMVWRGQ